MTRCRNGTSLEYFLEHVTRPLSRPSESFVLQSSIKLSLTCNGRTRGHLYRFPDDYRSFEPDYPAFPGWLGNGEIIKKQKYSIQRCTSCVSGFR